MLNLIESHKEIINLYQLGNSSTFIAKIYKTNPSSVLKILKENNILIKNHDYFNNFSEKLKEKVKYLFLNSDLKNTEIAKNLNIKTFIVAKILKLYNLKSSTKESKIDKQKSIIIKLYNQNISSVQIAKQLKISTGSVLRVLKSSNIEIRDSTYCQKRIFLTEDYFENIDSKDKAYFLGLLMADGCISENRVIISLQEEDGYILEKFANYIKINKKIKFLNKQKENWKNKYVLNFTSKRMVKDLAKYGIIPKKSHFTYFPNIPEEFYSHFIRGVFDGDGCISITKDKISFSVIGNIDLIKEIQNKLVTNLNFNKNNLQTSKKNKNIKTISYSGRLQVLKIYDYLYKDCGDLFLKRKKEKFESLPQQKTKLNRYRNEKGQFK